MQQRYILYFEKSTGECTNCAAGHYDSDFVIPQTAHIGAMFVKDYVDPDKFRVDLVSGDLVPFTKDPYIIPNDVLIHNAYPNHHQLIDLLYHAMDIGEIPKATVFYDTIKAIKTHYGDQ